MTNGEEEALLAAAKTDNPANFLAALGDALRTKQGVDLDLVEILATHLLNATPAVDALAKAKDAIVKLAGERATPKQDGSDA